MTDDEFKLWGHAAKVARLAMGKTDGRKNRNQEWKADLDPLAWWCLTETIMSFRNPDMTRIR